MKFGREPAGLSATGEADIRAWYDAVHAERVERYQPVIESLVQLIAQSLGIEHPEAWGITWPSLWQESPKEHAERQKLVAETDNAYIQSSVLGPEEVAIARYGQGEWSGRAPQLDTDGREALRRMELEGPLEEDE